MEAGDVNFSPPSRSGVPEPGNDPGPDAGWRTHLWPALVVALVLGVVWAFLAPGLRPWVGVLLAVITLWLAHARGFNAWCWLFAAGPIGILALLVMPPIRPGDSELQLEGTRRWRASLVGGLVSGANLAWLGVSFWSRSGTA